MGTESALVLDEFASWSLFPLEGPHRLDDVKLDALCLQLVDDGERHQLPMFSLGEIVDFLVHGFFELVPIRLSSSFTEMHGVGVCQLQLCWQRHG